MDQTSAETVLEPDEVQDAPAEGEGELEGEQEHELEAQGAAESAESLAPAEAETQAQPGPPEPGIDAEPGAGEQLSDEELVQSVVALIFASPEPLSERRLVQLLEGPRIERVRSALATARERLAAAGLPIELRLLAGGHQLLTQPELGPLVQRLFKARKSERISAAALETLAVIAYRQPVTKAEIEAIRGVQAGPILRTLVDRGLVRVDGRADVPGHPLQYGTTRTFLDRFGLGSLEELPRDSELSRD
ncbi:MAG: SMC-Scp complex subunit ScpB [Planctomycetes bacterium]|nr:SMC-Scp complex subunit ScpB [Planctomycetota bacterium]